MKNSRTLLLFFVIIIVLTGCNNKNQDSVPEEFQIETATIGVKTGTTGELCAIQSFPDATIISYNEIMDAVVALKTGKIDVVITANITTLNIARENDDLEMFGGLLTNEYVAAGLRKDDTVLLEQINAVIASLEADGTFDDMQEHWFSSYSPIKTEILQVDGEALRIGTSATSMPFTYTEADGSIVGYSPELAMRIGLALDRKVEFVSMSFPALIPALESGKIDCIIDMMSATEERKQFIHFSDPYYTAGQSILKRADQYETAQKETWVTRTKKSFYQNLIVEQRYMILVKGLGVTILIAIIALILGTVLGFTLYFMRASRYKAFRTFASIYVMLLRGTPMVVLLMIMYYVVFASIDINPIVVAIIAFGLNSGAFIGEIIRSSIMTVDHGQIEAARSMGFSKSEAFMTITFPQAARIALPVYKSDFISLVKGTSIVGYIAIVDLTKAGDIIRSRTYDAFFPLIVVAFIYLAAIGLLIWFFGWIEKKTDKRRKMQNIKKAHRPI